MNIKRDPDSYDPDNPRNDPTLEVKTTSTMPTIPELWEIFDAAREPARLRRLTFREQEQAGIAAVRDSILAIAATAPRQPEEA